MTWYETLEMEMKGKNSGSIGDFAFNDSDPEK
jgi:hypothetical protein